jgi:protein-disulfide reductase (glutathione)
VLRLVLSLCGVLVLGACAKEDPPPAGPPRSATADAHGFGESIPWEPLEGALAHAKSDGMPVMLVVHASWCKRCKELKPAFSDAEIEALSQRFVMVNADQDAQPEALAYAPDGDYIPRIVFISPQGVQDLTLKNEGRQRHRYFYTPGDDLAGVMRKALSRHERTPPSS